MTHGRSHSSQSVVRPGSGQSSLPVKGPSLCVRQRIKKEREQEEDHQQKRKCDAFLKDREQAEAWGLGQDSRWGNGTSGTPRGPGHKARGSRELSWGRHAAQQ